MTDFNDALHECEGHLLAAATAAAAARDYEADACGPRYWAARWLSVSIDNALLEIHDVRNPE